MAVGEEGGAAYTEDGTVDIRGNPVLRSKTGGLKACSFIVVYEVFERMAFYGISSNLVIYLTNKLHQGTVTSANNVTNWAGTIWLTPVLGAYIADAHLGRYRTFVIASAIYLLGMIVLTVTVSIHGLQPPPCANLNVTECEKASPLQLGLFFGALYILTIGTGGTKANIPTIGADQFDEFDPKEKNHKLSFFNWWAFSIFFGTLFASTVIVYIQDNVGWTLGYGLPTLGVAISIMIFLVGTPFYRHKKPSGSPFTIMARVMVAALRKWKIPVPKDAKELYELDLAEYTSKGKFRIDSTPSLRFLNKASVRTSSTSPWNICPVTQVEETKQMLRMVPIMISMFIPNVMFAQANTLFIKQGTTLQRTIGGFNIPPASLGAFITVSMLIFVLIYDRYFVKIVKKWTKNPRGITMLQGLGIGIVIYIFIMLIASFTERYRLSVARSHGLVEKRGLVPLSIFILLPQFILMGAADAFLVAANLEFYYDQAPENMKSMGSSYTTTTLGAGNFLSSFLLSVVDRITKEKGSKGWIRNSLNASHLDYYYAFFTILNVLNLIYFLYVAKTYVYKAEVSDSMEVLRQNIDGSKSTAANQPQSVN